MALAVVVLRVRGEADEQARVARFVHEGNHTRKNLQPEIAIAVPGATFDFKGRAVGVRRESAPRIEGVVGVAHGAQEMRFIEMHAVRCVHIGIRADERGFRVEDQSIEIEDEGANHGSREPAPTPAWARAFFVSQGPESRFERCGMRERFEVDARKPNGFRYAGIIEFGVEPLRGRPLARCTARMPKKTRSSTVYFASELFTLKHLIGNAYLAEAIYEKSHGRYLCELPQDFEPRGSTPRAIRDQDIRALVACDLAIFNFDGSELDSGTVIEFMFAKFADIPSVILRSDLRAAGDSTDPWNLMASFYPRTVNVVVPSLLSYKAILKRRHRRLEEVIRLAGQHSSADAQTMCDEIAGLCVRALDRVREMEPVMPKHLREEVYNWIALMPGLRGKEKALRKEFERYLERKVERDLL